MKPLNQLPREQARQVTTVLTDIDDTLTTGGKLSAQAYEALESLQRSGLRVIPGGRSDDDDDKGPDGRWLN